MEFTLTFVRVLFWTVYLVGPVLVFLMLIIIILGQIVGQLEKWRRYDSLYWAFITATTVGYGDIRPVKKISKALSVFIALVGMIFTGIIISVALSSTTVALEKHGNQQTIDRMVERFR